ncbi:hypothetical protein [Pseudoalteromonas phage vB_PalP_Y7]|nr:hypothetical protein [Pseudoalteromonas phage vB_PalP_Y7]
MSYIVGEVYIISVHNWHANKGEQSFYNVRAECIGKNNIGNVGYFADIDGNVFHGSSPFDATEDKSLVDKKDIIPRYPLIYGVWRKIDPPKKLQPTNQ